VPDHDVLAQFFDFLGRIMTFLRSFLKSKRFKAIGFQESGISRPKGFKNQALKVGLQYT
jgi:hypothetical protein